MELFDTLGPEIARELSARRESVPRAMLLGDDALERLAAMLASDKPDGQALVLYDARTREVAGARCAVALRRRQLTVHELLAPDREDGSSPVCDDLTKDALKAAIPTGFAREPAKAVIVGVGSGVISDLSKWLAFELGCDGAIVATAASMNGYAAANVAPAIAGVKTLVHARAHRVIAAEPSVLAHAPYALTSAGLGDVIAKTVSSADWKCNDILFGEDYRPSIVGIFDHIEERFFGRPEALAAREPEAVAALLEALVLSGCAMTLQGSSLPASGGEHLISHTLDMRAEVDHVRHDLHGRQVGLGTIFAAALYERVLSLPSPPPHGFDARPLPLDSSTWGQLAAAIAPHHQKQSARMAAAAQKLSEPAMFARVKSELAPMLPKARWIKDVLRRAGAAHRVTDIGIDRERFLWAVQNCAQIRERFTSIDLGFVTRVLPGAAESIVDELLL